jgi:hypothetical protein
MRTAARAHAQTLTPEVSFQTFWDVHVRCLQHAQVHAAPV